MKKLLILMLSIATLTACSNDDDSGNTNEEKILGTWFLVEANNVPTFELNDCTSQSNITFNADNSALTEYYGTVEGECVSDEDNTTWSKSSSKYTFDVPSFGPVTGTVTFNSDSKFTFVPDALPTASMVFEK